MASNGMKQLGVTAPLSTAQPTEEEKKTSNDLLEELRRENNFETTAETNKRCV
jgi:poly(A) polymerase